MTDSTLPFTAHDGPLTREFFTASAIDVAPLLLGAFLTHDSEEGAVTLRITEVEAYLGDGSDPGSHAHRGKTNRNASMFGEPGHLYAYFTYGMHTCANMVCSPGGQASGVLLRGAEVVDGIDLARSRRGAHVRERNLARGPACLVVAAGIGLSENGSDLLSAPFDVCSSNTRPAVRRGPRTGLSGVAGGADFPWRFWIADDPHVSAYKKHPKALP